MYVIVVSETVEDGCGTAGCSYTLDVSPDAATATTFRSLSARSTARGVLVRWRTASEVETLGFNVYRSIDGKRVRGNRRPIAAARSSGGHAYSFLDRSARKASTVRYWIQAVSRDGTRSWYGPARVSAR
jgi:hypothetical protein